MTWIKKRGKKPRRLLKVEFTILDFKLSLKKFHGGKNKNPSLIKSILRFHHPTLFPSLR